MNSTKCIVSLSGGRDSATCLGFACQTYGAQNVYSIGFDYGSKHPQELDAARKIAAYYEVPFQLIKIDPSIFEGSMSTLLKGSKQEVEKGKTYSEIIAEKGLGKVDTYVPARNTLFSAYLLARAESLSQKLDAHVVIMLGQHADDCGFVKTSTGETILDSTKAAYPDCSIQFVEAFTQVALISSVGRVNYCAPFINKHKWELIYLGKKLFKPVPYNLCLSCYDPIVDKDGNYHECGKCATCLDVIAAEKIADEKIKEDEKHDKH